MRDQGTTGDGKSVEALRHQLDKVRRECLRLQQENDRLRGMLGLPSEASASSARMPSAGTLFPDIDPLPCVTSTSSVEQKIALFRTLFKGRDDVYPVRWVNTQTGKKGYVPAVKGGWKRRQSGGPLTQQDYLPLTDAVIRHHLEGQQTIGVYPLLRDDTCWFLACDFDGKAAGLRDGVRSTGSLARQGGGTGASEISGWALDALGYLAACERHGISAYLERSQSGKGGHVWMFFSAPVPAVSARRLGTFLLRETMESRAEMTLASYDRLFPSQDVLPKGGFGNLIALPLQKPCRAWGNTEFLDGQMRPWPDQWAFLSSITRVSPPQLEEFLEQIAAVAAGPGSAGVTFKSLSEASPAPPRIICALSAAISIEKAGLPPWLLADIKHLASLHNPVFYERQKLRLSTFRTPRFISCYEEDVSHLHLPRGLLGALHEAVQKAGSSLSLTDLRRAPDQLSLSFKGTLTPLQEQAVRLMLAHDHGVLVAPPGVGKTVMACSIAAKRNLPVLVLVHRQPLLDQWRVHLMNLLGLSSKEIGQLSSGKDRRTRLVDLAMIQTLKNVDNVETFFADYGLLIVDECHHLPAFSFESCVKRAPIRYVLGLTATPYRRDGLQDLIVMQCGPVRHTISGRQAGAHTDLTLDLVVRETGFIYPTTEEPPIQEVFRALVNDAARTRMVSDDILAALSQGHRCLVLSERKEHCRSLAERFSAQGKTPFILDGGIRKKAREAILEAVRTLPSEEGLLLIATGQYLGEGFDCPQIDTLFLTFPVSFKGKLVQYVGRLMRSHEGKRGVRVYDYADVRVPVLKKIHGKRKKVYERLGFLTEGAPQPEASSLLLEHKT